MQKSHYDNPWLFNGNAFYEENILSSVGFVYMICNNITGKKYIGRKYFYSIRKPNNKAKRRKTVSADWENYYGSSEELLKEIELHGKKNFSRIILSLHKTRGDTNMNEVREQFRLNVLEDDMYINANINGKWRRTPKHIIEARRIADK